jgi:hypothetical protein
MGAPVRFTHIAIPEENSIIEAFHSTLEKDIVERNQCDHGGPQRLYCNVSLLITTITGCIVPSASSLPAEIGRICGSDTTPVDNLSTNRG